MARGAQEPGARPQSWDKQQAIAALVGEHSSQLDTENGIITFNDRPKLPVQILGTESDVSNSWLWAWANKVTPLPPNLLANGQ